MIEAVHKDGDAIQMSKHFENPAAVRFIVVSK